MKEFYNLNVSWMNGTVTIQTEVTSYPTKEMAEVVEKKVLEYNKHHTDVSTRTSITKGVLFETLDEVPIMQDNYGKLTKEKAKEE